MSLKGDVNEENYFLLVLIVLLFASVSCKSVETSNYGIFTNLSSREYVELGRVVVQGNKGYLDLLKVAQKIYPECDDIIDIYIDDSSLKVSIMFIPFIKKRTTVATTIKFTDGITNHQISHYA